MHQQAGVGRLAIMRTKLPGIRTTNSLKEIFPPFFPSDDILFEINFSTCKSILNE
jgi:hypothetical protein